MWAFWRKLKPAASPEERVLRFLKDYQAQHRAAKPLFDREELKGDRFSEWVNMLRPVKQGNFTDTSPVDLGSGYGNRPDYASRADEHVRSDSDGDITYVIFTNQEGMFGKFHEYVVESQRGDFKIRGINTHYHDPALPFVDAATIAERQKDCAADAPLIVPPENEALLDSNRNFTNREVTDAEGETSQAQVDHVGELTTSSGVLAVWDFGWDNDDPRPLARTVPPGTYPIDRVTAFGRNAAVRVRFSDEPPVSWWLANRVGQESDTVGVDAGCICIVDYAGYASMTPRAKASAYESFNQGDRPAVGQFLLGESNRGFACDSGWGDGSYPVYWGLDTDGQVAQLMVDFSVLVIEEDGSYKHL